MQLGGGSYAKLKEIASKHGMTIAGLDDTTAFEKKNNVSGKVSQYEIDEYASQTRPELG